MRSDRTGLPEDLREVISMHTGKIGAVTPASAGNHADVSATLETGQGRMFLKAARKSEFGAGAEVRSLRAEAAVNEYVTAFAPRLLWTAEAGEWLALGFEHVEGRPADYAPGSEDLEVLADLVHALQFAPCPGVVRRQVGMRWQKQTSDISPFAGDALLHADLNADNLIVTDGRVFLVDWAFASRGAAWLELGLLVPWLLKAGHSPREADAWLQRFPSWVKADAADIDLFSEVFAATWRSRTDAAPWVAGHAARARRWADYRVAL